MTKQVKLKSDIKSTLRPDFVYGRAGDTVTIIATHGKICLVEDCNKSRYAVPADQLTNETVIIEAAPATAATKPIKNSRAPRSRTEKPAPLQTNPLFNE